MMDNQTSMNLAEDEVTDQDLAKVADWAEKLERAAVDVQWKTAYGAIRQGADWVLRRRVRARAQELETVGKSVIRKVGVQ